MNLSKIALSGILAIFLLSGCTTKTLNNDFKTYSKKGYQNLKDGEHNSVNQKIKDDEIRINKNYIDLSITKDLSVVLKELGLKNNRMYILQGKDIPLKKSVSSKLLNITDFYGLKKYIEDTTNYTISIASNKYFKNRVKKVILIDKEAKKAGFDNIEFHINGKQSVSAALSSLAKKINYSVVYDKDLNDNQNNISSANNTNKTDFIDKDISYNGHNINDFLNYIQQNFNVYTDIDYVNKIISIKKYKTNVFAIYPLNYKITQDSTTTGIASSSSGSTASTGSTSSSGGTQSTKQSYSSNIVETIKTDLENLLVKDSNSKLIFNLDSGEVLVKTTNNNMGEIKNFIEKINNVYNQQMEITVDIYEFVLNRNFNFGTDISSNGSSVQFETTNLVDSILRGTFKRGGNEGFSVNSSNKFLRYSKSYSYKQIILNNISKTIAIQNKQDYVKSISSTTTTNTATTTASNTEVSSVNQGISMDILPRIIGDRISLKTDININNLNEFKTSTDGNGNTILLPDTDTKNIPSHLIIKNGNRILVGSYQDYQDVKSYNGIAPISDFIIGGASGKKFVKKEILVVLSAKIIK